MQPNRRQEQQILELVDKLIETAMATSVREAGDRQEAIGQGVDLVRQLRELVLPFLEGRSELAAEMLRQLLAQKLPDRRVLASFGDFGAILEEILEAGLRADGTPQAGAAEGEATGDTSPVETESPAGELTGPLAAEPGEPVAPGMPASHGQAARPKQILRDSLGRVFPADKVVEHYSLAGGVYVQYYLPDWRLAVEEERADSPAERRKEFFCRQAGIRLVRVPKEAAGNWRQVARLIRQAEVGVR